VIDIFIGVVIIFIFIYYYFFALLGSIPFAFFSLPPLKSTSIVKKIIYENLAINTFGSV